MIKGTYKNTLYSYDNNGNLTTEDVDVNGGVNIVSTYTYTTAGQAGPNLVPNKIAHKTTSTTYNGKPPHVIEKELNYDFITGNITDERTFSVNAADRYSKIYYEYANINTSDPYPGLVGSIAVDDQDAVQVYANRFTSFSYDPTFRFGLETTDHLGQVSTKSFDYKNGNLISETGIDNLVTTYSYDVFGRLSSTVTPQGHAITDELLWYTGNLQYALYFEKKITPGLPDIYTYYDRMGRVIQKETFGYNPTGNNKIIQVFGYDKGDDRKGFGARMTYKTDPFYEGDTPLGVDYFYDDYGRPGYEAYNNMTTQFSYSGMTSTVTSPSAIVKSKTVDAMGNLTLAVDDAGTVSYVYESNGKPGSITTNGAVTTMVYDGFGRQLELNEPNAGHITYKYSGYNEIVEQTDARGITTNILYDPLGRIDTKACTDGSFSFNTYVSAGNGGAGNVSDSYYYDANLKQTSDHYIYDNFGQVINYNQDIAGTTLQTSYTYDIYGNVDQSFYPSGYVTTNVYDNGYLYQVSDNQGNTLYTLNGLTANSQPKSYTYGNGQEMTFSYDVQHLPTAIALSTYINPTVKQFDHRYDWDHVNGNLNNRSDNIRTLTESFTYDRLQRLESWNPTSNHKTTSYNFNGNIKNMSDMGNYTYDVAKVHAVTGIDNTNGIIPTPVQTIMYNAFSKVTKIADSRNEYELLYGPGEQRAKTILTDLTTLAITSKYFGPGYEAVETFGTINEYRHYISGPDGVVAMTLLKNGTYTVYNIYKDYLGSVLALVEAGNGAIAEEHSYDAWGRERDPSTWNYLPSATYTLQDRGYTGHEHIGCFITINMNGRLYDPLIGRMLSVDNFVASSTSTQAFNRYSYAFNNPLKYTDPDGNHPVIIAAIIAGAYLGASMANNSLNPVDWDLKNGKTYAGAMLGGFAGFGAAHLGIAIQGAIATSGLASIFSAGTVTTLSYTAAFGASFTAYGFVTGFTTNYLNTRSGSQALKAGGEMAGVGAQVGTGIGAIYGMINSLTLPNTSMPDINMPVQNNNYYASTSNVPEIGGGIDGAQTNGEGASLKNVELIDFENRRYVPLTNEKPFYFRSENYRIQIDNGSKNEYGIFPISRLIILPGSPRPERLVVGNDGFVNLPINFDPTRNYYRWSAFGYGYQYGSFKLYQMPFSNKENIASWGSEWRKHLFGF